MPLARTIASRSATRSLARRLVGVFAATGLATTLGWAAVAAPVAQADDPAPVDVTNVVTKSKQAEAWQEIEVNADWSANSPRAGQTLTVDLGEGLHWASGVDFKLVKKDDESVTLGDCSAAITSQHLTCTLNSSVEQWDHVDGTLWARGQLTTDLIGKTESSVVVNGKTFRVVPGDSDGDGVCDTDHCDGVIPEQPRKELIKTGWLSNVKDGAYTWTWGVNVYGSTSYTVVDSDAAYDTVECTDTDWSNKWKPQDAKYDKDSHTVTWTVSSPETVCRVFYMSTSTADSKDNTATVNGQSLSATANAVAVGRGDGNGTTNPAPAPTPSTTPAPTPSDDSTPVPTPSETFAAGAPVEPAPPVNAPAPGEGEPAPEKPAAPTAAASKAPEEAKKPALAHTGAAAGTAGLVAVAALAAGGLGLTLSRRRSA